MTVSDVTLLIQTMTHKLQNIGSDQIIINSRVNTVQPWTKQLFPSSPATQPYIKNVQCYTAETDELMLKP